MSSDIFYYKLSGKSTMADRVQGIKAISQLEIWDSVLKQKEFCAIKLHIGEKRNTTYIKPEITKIIVNRVKRSGSLVFLTETSTLYKGQRANAVDHINMALEHGYTPKNVGASFIMADGLLGDSEIDVEIPGEIFKSVSIAREAIMADSLVVLSHPTGHLGCGLGAAIKNVGMGLASRKGKMRQHSAIKPFVIEKKCVFCQKCLQWCPESAIIEQNKKAFIQENKCIGCGECLAVCTYDSIGYNWSMESAETQKRMAEHTLGVVQNKRDRCLFLNLLWDMTKDCDCIGSAQEPIIDDVGILLSFDPVAIDQATLDLTARANGKSLAAVSFSHLDAQVQIDHGQKIGLGSKEYKLIEMN
ncbi:MAG: DUF362 domain-containing protein [Spirochaetales bacterium]|nr:DUF362 domain-containing protein [Spirochaetales bacterium]